MSPPSPAKQGFTLVELAIVLVILGLLVGGVLTGQSLIRAAQLRSVTTDVNRYTAAVQTFRDKYFALPGDMTNATQFWGTDPSGCPNGGGSTGVCNGNGDGMIGWQVANQCENQELWRHLARAGLVEGNYTTLTAVACAAPNTAGTNLAKSRFSNTAIAMIWNGSITSSGVWPGSYYYTASYNHVFNVGAVNGTNWMPMYTSFTTEDAWNIDSKIDDGRPDSGTVYSYRQGTGYGNANCATSATPGSANYSLNLTGIQCSLIIKAGF